MVIYLGSDRVQVCLANEKYNEIKQYLQGRYISASEAAWRLLKFKIHDHSPTVYRLGIHLPDHNQSFSIQKLRLLIRY